MEEALAIKEHIHVALVHFTKAHLIPSPALNKLDFIPGEIFSLLEYRKKLPTVAMPPSTFARP